MLVSTFGSALQPYFRDNRSNQEITYKDGLKHYTVKSNMLYLLNRIVATDCKQYY